MKWQGRRTSNNIEDRRGASPKGAIGGGIGGGILVLIIVLLVTYCGGGDLTQVLNNDQVLNPATVTTYQETLQEKELSQFVSVVLAETEDVWTEVFNSNGMTY